MTNSKGAVLICALCTLVNFARSQQYLQISNGQLQLNGEKVFMSGMNQAWYDYGNDFGNGRYNCCTGAALEDYLRRISAEGGNSLRIWLHCGGTNTPQFDAGGFVVGTDASNTLINDLSKFLDVAYSYNILVFIVLFNGDVAPSTEVVNLMYDNWKRQTYIDTALVPMVSALSGKVALGGWEIMNEPEGLVYADQMSNNPCYDTRPLAGTGAGWVNLNLPMQLIQGFVNKLAGVIKRTDPKTLVTVGSWSERAQTDNFGYRNYYTDGCLHGAGGDSNGTIDFYQMHSYLWEGSYTASSPLNVASSQYGLDKPVIIGEFSQVGGDGRTIQTQLNHAYYQGYSGGWTWQANGSGDGSDDFATQAAGMNSLRGLNDQSAGGRVDIILQ